VSIVSVGDDLVAAINDRIHANSTRIGASYAASTIGIDLQRVQHLIVIALLMVLAVDGLTVINGIYVGLQRTTRQAGARPACATCCALRCCRCTFGCTQGAFAVLGALVLWSAIVVLHIVSSVVLVILAITTFWARYSDNVTPLLERGLELSASTLSTLNMTQRQLDQMQDNYEFYQLYANATAISAGSTGFPPAAFLPRSANVQRSSLMAMLSPLPTLIGTTGSYFGIADASLAMARDVLLSFEEYSEFYFFMSQLVDSVKPAFHRMYIGSLLALLGQVLVFAYHTKYYTVYYYEQLLLQRRLQAARRHKQARSDESGPMT